MDKADADKAAKVGDLLFRYMRARHRFRETVERPLPAHELAALIGRGKQEFDEVYVEPDANPPIVLDGKADDVFDAIIKKRYRAIPFWDPQLVAAWRHHVLSDGPMPRKPGPRRPKQPEPPTPRDGLDMENARCAWMNSQGCHSTTTGASSDNSPSREGASISVAKH